ncbi:MAG: rod shape-determining protein RodA [Deltaproteobacteria bacterium]|nr:rod shape-determining protein RodA [Deltaproteobacteria bacterium]
MIDRRVFLHFDWVIFLAAIGLAFIGIVNIYSAAAGIGSSLYMKQFYWFVIGIAAIGIIALFNYSQLERFAYFLYGMSITLLVAVHLFGRTTAGAKRWLNISAVSFQPSEFAKIALVVMLAKYFNETSIPRQGMSMRDLMLPGFILIVPFVLVAKQPDLGTALILLLIFVSMALFVKVKRRTLIGITLAFMPFIPFAWHFLKDYQKARLMSFIDPKLDPMGTGYNLIQSKIAIGSGGVMGKGFIKGTQGQLKFLPEHHTDFIFSVLAEEWGFVGAVIVIMLFLTIIMWGLHIAQHSKDRFGTLLAFGVSAMFFWHAAINLGMVMGLLPVVGVPLPFMSYGGSFLLTVMIGVGILINVSMRRFMF